MAVLTELRQTIEEVLQTQTDFRIVHKEIRLRLKIETLRQAESELPLQLELKAPVEAVIAILPEPIQLRHERQACVLRRVQALVVAVEVPVEAVLPAAEGN